MEIQLEQVRREPFVWQETRSISAALLERPELQVLGGVTWWGRIGFVDPGFLLQAELDYEQTLACTRCLTPSVEPVHSRVELLIVVGEATPGGGERELKEDELGVLALREPILETDPILLEQLQLNIPMVALCRPDCAGLCPRCGADRNLERCACVDREMDPRWEELARLRGRFDGD